MIPIFTASFFFRYYETGETLEYESIENEWPIFFLFMIIDGMFKVEVGVMRID